MIVNFLSSHPYAATTQRTYSEILTRFLSENPTPKTLSARDLIQWIQRGNYSNARQCLMLACIVKFLRFQYGANHAALGAKIKRSAGKLQRAITKKQLDQLLATFDRHTPKGARDLAIASLLIQSGFRAAEVCRLKQADTDTERGRAQVIVKGGQWRIGIFSADTAAHIEHWKRYRETLTPQRGYLFVSLKHKYTGNGLTPEGLNRIIAKWGTRIGIKLSPHDFRRGYATQAVENGGPDTLIMYGGGWSSQNSFNRYTLTANLDKLMQYLPSTEIND